MTGNEVFPATIRQATPSDRSQLIAAIIELQEHERRLHDSLRPGVEIAAPYLASIEARAARQGAILVAETDEGFVGFVAGWIRTGRRVDLRNPRIQSFRLCLRHLRPERLPPSWNRIPFAQRDRGATR